MATDHAPPRPAPAELAALAEATRGTAPQRVWRIEAAGQGFWVKTEERPTLRMRLQKGNPRRAFAAERRAMKVLAAAGLPVPPILAEGDDFFVTPDCGPSLRQLLHDEGLAEAGRLAAFRAAAEGLARFHAQGQSHGRPSLKDICWDGRAAWLLDLERFAARRNSLKGHAEDLVMLFLSAYTETGGPTPETAALAESYRAHDPGGVWQAAARFCRRMRWIDPLTMPIQRLRGGREFRAIPLTFRTFGPA